jgi:hypothetical protein
MMIETCLETTLHKKDGAVYVGAGAADNSHPGNDDFRADFYNIVRTLALNTHVRKICQREAKD